MRKIETLVVGAGPGGSTAARELSSQGTHVLLLDRAAFPRDKPCGGGVTTRAAKLMPEGFAEVVEGKVFKARLSYRQKPHSDYESRNPLTYMTQRRRLDEFLVKRAIDSGVEFHDGEKVTGISTEERGRYQVKTDKDTYSCDVVVGADGANGIVAQSMEIQPRHTSRIALEGNSHAKHLVDYWSESVGLDFGSIPGGYGWLFTKDDHVNIGVYGYQSVGPQLRAHLDKVSRHYGIEATSLDNLKGHHLPTRKAGFPVVKDRVLLVGDAAALVDPITGEGIYSALVSGKLAADVVISGRFSDYQEEVERNLGDDLEFARRLQTLLYWKPLIDLLVLKRSPKVWGKIEEFLQGIASYSQVKEGHALMSRLINLLTS